MLLSAGSQAGGKADEDVAFAKATLQAALRRAHVAAASDHDVESIERLSGPMMTMGFPTFINYQLGLSMAVALFVAEYAAHLIGAPPPVVSLVANPETTVAGTLLGIPAALAVSQLERWRAAASVGAAPMVSILRPLTGRQTAGPPAAPHWASRLTPPRPCGCYVASNPETE